MAKKRIAKQTDVVTEMSTDTHTDKTTPEQKEVGQVAPKAQHLKLENFRLSTTDQANLKKILGQVNELSKKPISKTLVIRALLSLGCGIKPEKILKEATAILKANVDLQLKA